MAVADGPRGWSPRGRSARPIAYAAAGNTDTVVRGGAPRSRARIGWDLDAKNGEQEVSGPPHTWRRRTVEPAQGADRTRGD